METAKKMLHREVAVDVPLQFLRQEELLHCLYCFTYTVRTTIIPSGILGFLLNLFFVFINWDF